MTAAPAPVLPAPAPGPDPVVGRPAITRSSAPLLILAALIMIKAASFIAVVLGAQFDALRLIARSTVSEELILALRGSPWAGALLTATGVLLFVTGILLLQRRRLGWLLAMVTTGVFVAADIYGFLTTGTSHFWMALNILTVFYLNQREVREVVGLTPRSSSREAAE